MKNIKFLFLILFTGIFMACKEEPVIDYAILKGDITNPLEGQKLRLYNPENSESILITVKKDGSFLDTLRLEQPTSFNVTYNGIFQLYISNGMDLTIDFDAENLGKTLSFDGKGSADNEFIRFKSKKTQELIGEDYQAFLILNEEEYNGKKQAFSKEVEQHIEKNKSKMDADFITSEKKSIDELLTSLDDQRKQQFEIHEKLGKGKPSPKFENYKNYEGGTASLEDFEGSYVYIDIWATWCVPCIVEMPFMREIEKEYEGKNIKFIGLSVDTEDHEDKWRKMIVNKDLATGATQLLADNDMQSEFIQNYYINAIPRFILLDPKGNIVSYDAPRPSEDKLKDLLNSLDI